jgi:hypothetical protein
LGDLSVGIGIVRDIGGFIGRAARKFADASLVGKERFLTGQARLCMAFWQRVEYGFTAERRNAPGLRIFMIAVANVKDFSKSLRPVSVLHEILRKRDCIGI